MISIRKGKYSISGLKDTIAFCKESSKIPIRIIVEIGSFVGDSTKVFAMNFEKVISIDPWDNNFFKTDGKKFKTNMSEVEAQFDLMRKDFPNIKKMKMTGDSAVQFFEDESIDMVYIDALHTYEAVRQDLLNWYPKVKKGGIISGHDYQESFPGVMKAVNEFLGHPPFFIGKDSSWMSVK